MMHSVLSRLAFLMLLLSLGTALAGCGQKGPLYPPDDEQAAERYDPTGQQEASDEDARQDDANARDSEG